MNQNYEHELNEANITTYQDKVSMSVSLVKCSKPEIFEVEILFAPRKKYF